MSVLIRNNVTVTGTGDQTLVFAHGFGCDQHMWRFVAPSFEDAYRIVLFDHVGAGGSDLSSYQMEKYATLAGYADDVLEICTALDLKNAIFVGHSVSAMIGVLAAVKDPSRFAALVLIVPSPRYINDGDYLGGFTRADIDDLLNALDSNYLGWSHTMAPVIMGAPDQPELATELTESFCRTNPEIAKQFAHVTFLSDNRADLPLIRMPTLILQCREDIIAPLRVGEYVHRHIIGSQLITLEAVGHCPHLSEPEQTIAAIRQFLQTV